MIVLQKQKGEKRAFFFFTGFNFKRFCQSHKIAGNVLRIDYIRLLQFPSHGCTSGGVYVPSIYSPGESYRRRLRSFVVEFQCLTVSSAN